MNKPDETHIELLRDCGREISESLLKNAVESAESDEQMSNQLYALRWAAINILAHEAFNSAKQLGEDFNSYRIDVLNDLLEEFGNLCASEDTELVKIKAPAAPEGTH